MHRVPILRRKPLWLATLALCALVGAASAQQAVQEPVEQGSIDWRKANDEVSQFKRGHADDQSPHSHPRPRILGHRD